jgi:hypothetical protein
MTLTYKPSTHIPPFVYEHAKKEKYVAFSFSLNFNDIEGILSAKFVSNFNIYFLFFARLREKLLLAKYLK